MHPEKNGDSSLLCSRLSQVSWLLCGREKTALLHGFPIYGWKRTTAKWDIDLCFLCGDSCCPGVGERLGEVRDRGCQCFKSWRGWYDKRRSRYVIIVLRNSQFPSNFESGVDRKTRNRYGAHLSGLVCSLQVWSSSSQLVMAHHVLSTRM